MPDPQCSVLPNINVKNTKLRKLSRINEALKRISKAGFFDRDMQKKANELWEKEAVLEIGFLLGRKSNEEKLRIVRGIGINYLDRLNIPKKIERTAEIIANLESASAVESREEIVTLITLIDAIIDLYKKNFDFSKVKSSRTH